mgnify:CR=1 FL=1
MKGGSNVRESHGAHVILMHAIFPYQNNTGHSHNDEYDRQDHAESDASDHSFRKPVASRRGCR